MIAEAVRWDDVTTDVAKSIIALVWRRTAKRGIELLASDSAQVHVELARAAIADDISRRASDEEIAALAHEIAQHGRRLYAHFGMDDATAWFDDIQIADSEIILNAQPPRSATRIYIRFGAPPMLWLDAGLADYLERLGEKGAALATLIRNQAPQRWEEHTRQLDLPFPRLGSSPGIWKLWADSPPKAGALLASAVWHDVVSKRAKNAKAPSMSLDLFRATHDAALAADRTVQPIDEGRLAIYRGRLHTGELVADEAHVAVQMPILENLKTTRSIYAVDVLLWLLHRAYYQHYFLEMGDAATKIVIRGGFPALCRELGLPDDNKQTQDVIRAALTAFQCLRIRVTGLQVGGLLTWHVTSGKGSVLTVRLADAFRPTHAHDARLAKGDAWKRVPLPHPQRLPEPIGRGNEYGAQRVLAVGVFAEMREQAVEVARSGYAVIPTLRWREMATGAGYPLSGLGRLLDHWTSRNVFLERRGDLYTLDAKSFEKELASIIEAGEQSIKGKQRRLRRRPMR